jgi:glycosyltransferase involved in cell wall biosynthesis
MPPLISICVPNLNKRPFLQERMETLLAQTFTDWEMIVCDSYSNDGSWELLQQFKDPRIRLFQVPREGIYAGWNECLRRATGEYVNIATSDDTASPELLERLVEPLESRKNIDLSVCDFAAIDEHSKPAPMPLLRFREFFADWLNVPTICNGKTEFLMLSVFVTSWFTMAAVLFRRSLLSKTGLFRTDQGSFADTDWCLRATLATDIAHVPARLTTFRINEGQATPANCTPAHWKIYCQSLERVLDDSEAQIPGDWKANKDWRDRLMQYRRRLYHESFELYRWMARENLGRFLTAAGQSAVAAPTFFLKQALQGFPDTQSGQRNAIEEVQALLTTFRAEWPPEIVKHW